MYTYTSFEKTTVSFTNWAVVLCFDYPDPSKKDFHSWRRNPASNIWKIFCVVLCYLWWASKESKLLLLLLSGDRIPVGARFFAPVQTGLGAHPASYTVGTGSLLGVKRPGRGFDHPPQSSAEVVRVKLYLYSISGPSWSVKGWTLPLPSLLW
jgi:hypothetical protein